MTRLNPKSKPRKTINYIDAMPGVGKTDWAVNKINTNRWKKENIILYVAPTINLIISVENRIQERCGKEFDRNWIKTCHSDHEMTPVSKKIKHALAKAHLGDVILVTHTSFIENLELFFEDGEKIEVIFDEAYNLIHSSDMSEFNDVRKKLFDRFVTAKRIPGKSPYHILTLSDKDKLLEYIESRRGKSITGDMLKEYELFKEMGDRNKVVYAKRMSDTEQGGYIWYIVVMMSPHIFDIFKSTTILCAYFEYTMMYQVLANKNNMVCITEELGNSMVAQQKALVKRFKNVRIYPAYADEDFRLTKNCLNTTLVLNNWTHNVLYRLYYKLRSLNFTGLVPKSTFLRMFIIDKTGKGKNSFELLKLQLGDKAKQRETVYPPRYRFSDEKKQIIEDILLRFIKHLEENQEKFYLENAVVHNMDRAYSIIKSVQTDPGSNLIRFESHHIKGDFKDFTPFISISNASKIGQIVEGIYRAPEIKHIGCVTHGLNDWSNLNHVSYMAALNPSQHLRDMCDTLIPEYSFEQDWTINNACQGISRCSVRNADATETAHIVVPSLSVARGVKERMRNKPKMIICSLDQEFVFVNGKNFVPEKYKKEWESLLEKLRNGIKMGTSESLSEEEKEKIREKNHEAYLKAKKRRLSKMTPQEIEDKKREKAEYAKQWRKNRKLTATPEQIEQDKQKAAQRSQKFKQNKAKATG